MRAPRLVLAASLAALLGLTVTTPASATYPGEPGDIAFGSTPTGETFPEIYAAHPDGTGARRLTHHPAFDACAAYDADGERIAFCSGRTSPVDPANPSALLEIEIWTMAADGSDQRPVTDLHGYATFPDFAPHGHRLAFAWSTAAATQTDIWTVRDDGRHPRRLTDTPDHRELYPAYSPDGRWIAFIRAQVGQSGGQVWIMDRHGRRQRQLTFDPLLKEQLPDWHPDGHLLAYEAGRDVWVVDPDGTGQRRLTNTPGVQEYGPTWSPDGQRIAYLELARTDPVTQLPVTTRQVYTMRADGTDVQVVAPGTGLHFVPAWQPLPRDRRLR